MPPLRNPRLPPSPQGAVIRTNREVAAMSLAERGSALDARRPQRADAARNFDALVAAGREAFAEEGSAASLEDIARRAGVGIGTLYRNFPTRDDLIETLYLGEVDALARAADEVADLEPWDALRAWLDRFVTYVGTKHALLDGLNRRSPVLMECRTIMLSAGEPLLERAQAAGEVDPDVSIGDVVKLVSGVAAVASFDDDAQRERVLNLAINAIRR